MIQLVCTLLLAAAPQEPSTGQPPGSSTEPAVEKPTTMLRLESGDVLWGTIVAHAPEAIDFRRLDTGGVVHLPWTFLDPAEEEGLRLRFGYVEANTEELLVSAERLLLDDGTELVGLIVNRTDDHVWLKRAEGTLPIPKRRLVGGSTLVQAPALDVFTKEELYQREAFALQERLLAEGTEGARAHDELAQYAERLRDYAHALEHYRTARRLDPEYDSSRLSAAVARCETKAALAEQVAVLAEIDLMRARKRYDLAIELLSAFPELYPDSPLLEDWNDLRERVARYQERDLREEIVRRWHYWSVRLARDAARRLETYQEVLGYLDEQMGEELIAHVRDDVQGIAPGIESDDVMRLWTEREPGRYRQASYGIGTWLLGEDRALATLEKEEEEEEPAPGSQAAARRALEDRIQRYLKNQELVRKARAGSGADEEDPEEMWKRWNHSGRHRWILAYFVEFSGLFSLDRVRFSNCRECGGTGARDVVFLGSALAGERSDALVPCPTCHTLGRMRRIRYR